MATREQDVAGGMLEVRRWLELHPLPVAGAVVPASIALAVAVIAETGRDPSTLAGPGDLVEALAAIAVVERRRTLETSSPARDDPLRGGPSGRLQ